MPGSGKADIESGMYQTFIVESVADAGTIEQIYGALFEHTGTDAAQYILSAAPFENDRVNAGQM
jgi:hypothetical protein